MVVSTKPYNMLYCKTKLVVGNSAEHGRCWWLFAHCHSHRFSDPKQKVQFVASTVGFWRNFEWRLYIKSDFKDIVQLKPNLMSSPAEIHHNSGYIKALKTYLSWTECSPIMPDQFLSPNSSVKMTEEATMCTFCWLQNLSLSQPQISKSGN